MEQQTAEAATTNEGTPAAEAVATAAQTQPAPASTEAPAAKQEAAQTQEPAKPEGAPEKYEWKAPDGKEYSPEAINAFEGAARKANLTQAQADAFLSELAPAMEARTQSAIEAQVAQWEKDAKSDKEFGGEKFDENIAKAREVIDTYATPELKTLLAQSGLGNHPEMIRMVLKFAGAVSEDAFVGGRGGKQADASLAQRMYPNMNP